MICDPCKQGVHTGEQYRQVIAVHSRQGGKSSGDKSPVCKGGTWCDCQHRTSSQVKAFAKRVLA